MVRKSGTAAFLVMEEGLYRTENMFGVIEIRFFRQTEKSQQCHRELAGQVFQDMKMPRVRPIAEIP